MYGTTILVPLLLGWEMLLRGGGGAGGGFVCEKMGLGEVVGMNPWG